MTADHVFNQIVEEFRENRIPGWCTIEKAIDLAAAVIALRPNVIVEVGVFGGKSLLPMAMMCEALDCGSVIGIDPWNAQASTEGYSGENFQWWSSIDHEEIYRGFVANVERLGVKKRVKILRCKSDDARVPDVIDVWHADGQHSEQTIRDVKKFAPHIRVGGMAVLDDIDWKNDGVGHVALAVEVLKKLGFVKLYPSGTGAFFQRTSVAAPKRRKGRA